MKSSHEKQTSWTGWRRVISVILALSMVLIPVQFPSRVNAAEETEPEIFFKDDFSATDYETGVTYQWAEKKFHQENGIYFKDGKLYFKNVSEKETSHNHATVYLSAAGATQEYTQQWTDYSVEIKGGFISGSLAEQTHMGVMGRVYVDENGIMTFYYAYIKQDASSVWLYKSTIDASGKQTPVLLANLPAVKTAPDTQHTLKMTFDDNNIQVFVDGKRYINIDDESNFSPCGSVGIQLTRQGDAVVDYIKVTHKNPTEGFVDYFDTIAADNTYKWNNLVHYPANDSVAIGDGKINIAVTSKDNTQNYAGAYLTKPGDATDPTSQWENYSVEMKARILSEAEANGNEKVGLMGRVTVTDSTTTFYYAYFRYDKSSIWLYKVSIDHNDNNKISFPAAAEAAYVAFEDAPVKTAAGTDYVLKMTFDGNKISVSLNGTECISVTDDSYTKGSAGVFSNYTTAAQVDYFKVTMKDGSVAYADYFGDATAYQLGVTSKWNYKVGYVNDASVSISDGKLHFASKNTTTTNDNYTYASAFLNVTDGSTDYSSQWTDYSVEMKGRFLSTGTSQCGNKTSLGLIGRASVDGDGVTTFYYAYIRKDQSNVWLYKVTMAKNGKQSRKVITYPQAITTTVDKDYTLKMTFENNVVKVFVNDIMYINESVDTEDAEKYCAAGSVGVQYNQIGAAAVDYIKVFPVGADDGESYIEHTFESAATTADMNRWNFAPAANGAFGIENDQLTYTDPDSAVGIAALNKTPKTNLTDSQIIAVGSAAANGGFAVLGRYDAAANNYYKLSMDLDDGLKLIRCVGGVETVVPDCTISRNDLWEQYDVMLNPETLYELKLQIYGSRVEAYLDDLCLFYWDDPDWVTDGTLSAGVGAVEMQSGTKLSMLEIARVEAVTKLELKYDTNFNGKAADLADHLVDFDEIMEVPVGNVPDVKHLYLKVTHYDQTVTYVPVDMAQIGKFDVDSITDSVQTVPVTYGRQTIQLKYQVVDRTDMINQLNTDISNFDTTDLSKDDRGIVADLVRRYDDLTVAERAAITPENTAKLASAEKTMTLLLYPTLAGTEVVFEDTFDSVASEDLYTTDRTLTHTSYKGNWYVENGTMVQYFTDDAARTTSFQAATVVKDENWKIKSVSVDVQIIDRDVWIGLIIPYGEGDYYRFMISDKVSSYQSRVYLWKNAENIAYKHLGASDGRFQAGQWYNLTVVFDTDKIRCYIDGNMILETDDKITPQAESVMSAGTVGLYSTEGAGRFDNLVVRGVDADFPLQPTPAIRDAEDFADDFTGETAGKDPSHWIEEKVGDNWLNNWTVQNDSGNEVYATSSKDSVTHTWLHVFETDVDYSLMLKVSDKGNYPVVGLTARVNYADSYIKAGYDYTLQKWFIKVRYGTDFEEVAVYSDEDAAVDFSDWKQLRLKVIGSDIALYYGNGAEPVLTADALQKVMPGRVGVYTERCSAMIDSVNLKLLSEQGRVNEGVLEFYTEAQYCSILVLPTYDGETGPNDDYLMFSYGNREVSSDGGKTFKVTTAYGSTSLGTATRLHNGHYIAVSGGVVRYSTDCVNWTNVGQIPVVYKDENDVTQHTQTGDRIAEIKIGEDQYRIFFTVDRHVDSVEGYLARNTISEVYYSDDLGVTWTKSNNSAVENTNMQDYGETNIIQAADGKLLQYCSYNDSMEMRYMVSTDNGETWQGDYAIPYLIDGGQVSFCVKEDPYADVRTYYMATVYNKTQTRHQGMPRLRIALLRSYDGYNWEYLADVDRWGEHSEGPWTDIMQNINMYLAITPDAVFPMFCRAEEWSNTEAHNVRYGRAYRFDKDSLDAYDEWPLQYVLTGKEITYIEGIKENITRNSELSDLLFNVYYYRASGSVMDQITMDNAFVHGLDTSVLGEQTVTLDYKHFRTVFTVNVIAGDAPVISGVENGKTYCGAQTVTVTDANSDLASVTLNGNAVSLTDGKFTVSAAEGQQTIAATDKAGNATTITVTVNADHTWSATWTTENEQHWKECTVDGCEATTAKTDCSGGEADCQNKAVCETCNKEYGEKSTTHDWATEWTSDGTNHWHKCETAGCNEIKDEAGHTPAQDDGDCTTAIKCTVCQKVTTEAKANHTPAQDDGDCTTAIRCTVCQKVTTAAKESHTGGTATCEAKAECTVCGKEYGELAAHKGGEATCTDKAKCEVCGEAYGELNADKHTKEAKWTTTADKHSKAYECCGKVVVAEAAHEGGTATCEAKAKCEVCNAEYGALAAHKGGEATCTDKAKCEVCGEAYGELNADKHTKEAKWTTTADKHSKVYECCGKVVVAEEAHEWKDGKCEECGYEAAPGTEQKPIEIPADKETAKEEAKVEAGEEKHYELDEDMAGKVITVKGEGAYIIVDGKKYEAKNGIVEVKLPTKTGKISVVIGNAGTKAGAFSITIATPDDTNSDTGDNAAIVLFGSLIALSALAAGVLLIPGIRKKLTR